MADVLQSPLRRWKWLVPARAPGAAPAPLPCSSMGYWDPVLGLGNPHSRVCQGQRLAQSILAAAVPAGRHRQLQRDRPSWVHGTEQGAALKP